MKNIWRRFIKTVISSIGILVLVSAISCIIIGIIWTNAEHYNNVVLVCIGGGLLVLRYELKYLYRTLGLKQSLDSWVRKGVFKTKPVDNALRDIIKSNATIMSSIMATAKNAERVFTLKGLPLKIKLAAGIIYDHESHMAIYTKKGKSLVFSLSNGKLVNCNINNIFILPAVNEELEAIIGSHEDRKQVETEERDNTVDGFRDYVTAISDMLKSN